LPEDGLFNGYATISSEFRFASNASSASAGEMYQRSGTKPRQDPFGQGGPVKVFVATRPVDFRKAIDGLSLAVQEMFGLDPFCEAVFVFRSKRAEHKDC
jgi:hypothetical protein